MRAHALSSLSRALALVVAPIVLAGCLSLGSRPPPPRLWVLPGGAAPAPAAGTAPARVGLGPIRLPAYLDRPQVVTRLGPARLDAGDGDRWAAPLQALFGAALAEGLREAVPGAEVLDWPWPSAAAPDVRIAVEVRRFEREADGAAVLEARWEITRGAAGAAVRGETGLREAAATPDMAGSVLALARTVNGLARELGAAVAGPTAASAPRRP